MVPEESAGVVGGSGGVEVAADVAVGRGLGATVDVGEIVSVGVGVAVEEGVGVVVSDGDGDALAVGEAIICSVPSIRAA